MDKPTSLPIGPFQRRDNTIIFDPPTYNRPFADERDKVGIDGVPKITFSVYAYLFIISLSLIEPWKILEMHYTSYIFVYNYTYLQIFRKESRVLFTSVVVFSTSEIRRFGVFC